MPNEIDIAFKNKLQNYFPRAIWTPTELAYNTAYNLVDNPTLVMEFPFISVYRPDPPKPNETQTFSARRIGYPYASSLEIDSSTEDKLGVRKVNHYARYIVADLIYQIEVYARTQEEVDTIIKELMFAFSLDPVLYVEHYDSRLKTTLNQRYEIEYHNGPVDQSEFQDNDRIYHQAIAYIIKSAKLFNYKPISSISEVLLDLRDSEKNPEYLVGIKGNIYIKKQELTEGEYLNIAEPGENKVYIITDKSYVYLNNKKYEITKDNLVIIDRSSFNSLSEIEEDVIYFLRKNN